MLDDASQTTSSTNSQYVDSLSAALAATLAGTSVTRAGSSSTDAQGVTTNSQSRQTAQNTPGLPAPTALTVIAPTTSLTGDAGGATMGTEAQLKYQVAKALAEEVAILNNQVSSLVYRSGYRPYFVTIQVSILPKQHGFPYDTLLDLSFTTGQGRSLYVVPILITDSIENTRQNEVSDVVRQLGVELKANGGIVGASASLNRMLSQLDETLSLRPNSLLSVAKFDDHTIKVRLGANAMGESYEMIPRSHIISLVLLVPKSMAEAAHGADRTITVASIARYRSALSNAVPPAPTLEDFPLARSETFEIPHRLGLVCPDPQDVPLTAGILSTNATDSLPIQVGVINGGEAFVGRKLTASVEFSHLAKSDTVKVFAQDIRLTDFGIRVSFPDPSRFLPLSERSRGNISITVADSGDGDDPKVCKDYTALYAPATAPRLAQAPRKAKAVVAKADVNVPIAAAEAAPAPATTTTVKVQESTAPVTVPPQ